MKKFTFLWGLLFCVSATISAQHLTTTEELELLEASRAQTTQSSNTQDIGQLLNRLSEAGHSIESPSAIFTPNEMRALQSHFRSQNRDVLADIIPTAGATETFAVEDGDMFYDPSDGVNGGPGGVCTGTSSGDPGDYPNCGCVTVTTLTAADLAVTFQSFNVFGTFDFLNIYDGPDTSSPLLYDSNTNTTTDTFAGMVALVGDPPVFTATNGSLTFEFSATAVVNSCGWEAAVSTTGGGGGGGTGVPTAFGVNNATPSYGSFEISDPSVFTGLSSGSGTANFEGSGAIDINDNDTAYVIDNVGAMWSVDVQTGVYTSLGNVGVNDMTGLAFNPVDGNLYGVTTTAFYSIDIGAVSATLVGNLGTTGGLAIAFAIDGAGNAFTYDILDDALYSVNTATGAATLVGSVGFDANFGQGMSWDAETDQIYMAAFNNTLFDSELRSVDTATGNTTSLGTIIPGTLSQIGWVSVINSGSGGGGGGGDCTSTVYDATGLPSDIDPGDTSTADCVGAPNLYPVNVSGAGTIGAGADLEDVTINITHTWSGDLDISLISPAGTELLLWDSVGGSGDNFTNTQFQDGGIPSAGSTAPHTNIYVPVGGTFAATFDGEEINGDWQLKICDSAGGDTGTLDTFSITFCTEEPSNNFECADATPLACGDVVAGTTTGATNSGGNASPDVYFSYTGNGDQETVTISLCDGGTTYDSLLRVYESCDDLSVGAEIAVNDDFCGLQSEVSFESDGTTTYIIMVEGFGTGSGNFSLEITCELPPPPPACGGLFTDTGGVDGDYGNGEDEVWTINPDNVDDFVTVIFSAFDVEANWDALYVFDGPDTNSPLISSGNPPTTSGFPAGGYYGTTIPGPFASSHPSGALTFQFLSDGSVPRAGWVADVVCAPVPPPNDLIENAISVTNETLPFTDPDVRLQFATNELLNPDGCAIAGTNGVWYSFTAAADGTAEASITDPAGASFVIFYEAPSEDVGDETDLSFSPEPDNQCGPSTSSIITTVAGQSYYIFVLNNGGPSDVVIDIEEVLSTEDNIIDGFSFYPNPATNTLNLSSKTLIENVELYTMLGQKVISETVGAATSQIDVSALATGTYIMKVTAEGQTASYQVIKK